jgi:hypothetical protein
VAHFATQRFLIRVLILAMMMGVWILAMSRRIPWCPMMQRQRACHPAMELWARLVMVTKTASLL